MTEPLDPPTRPRILAVADSDSYFKFACSTLDALGPAWDRQVVLVRTPILPTPGQQAAATAGTFLQDTAPVRVLPTRALAPLLESADVVLAAATGPVVQEVFHRVAARHLRPTAYPLARVCRAARRLWRGHRVTGPPASSSPVRTGRSTALVSALPGVAYPATAKAMRFRALGDAFITHSHAEARDFTAVLAALGERQAVLTARLPFLASAGQPVPNTTTVGSVVFAAQAKFPVERIEREQVLEALARTGRANPHVQVIVKLRATAGGPQTHREAHPFDRLWQDLLARGRVGAGEVRFATGPMDAVLRPGTLLVSVSSTAVLEAVDRGLPAIVLGDFGVGPALYNQVFAGSGLVGGLADVEALDGRHPETGWLRDHYFHPPGPEPAASLLELARRARAGGLSTSADAVAAARRLAVRNRLRTALPAPALRLVRAMRR
ncbi:DUF6716 putative glycosyltransferase [Arthrobacter sp. JSM 101049]|uniref:DUF6716 putative glycosyltransferase n=1 Tax=Arthrobacter sp. JSM 101049 TaxID=929097 RepID=UPI00356A1FE2